MLWRATAVQAAMTGNTPVSAAARSSLRSYVADHFLIELLCGDDQMAGTKANELVACRSVRRALARVSLCFWAAGEPNPKSLLCAIALHALPLVLSGAYWGSGAPPCSALLRVRLSVETAAGQRCKVNRLGSRICAACWCFGLPDLAMDKARLH